MVSRDACRHTADCASQTAPRFAGRGKGASRNCGAGQIHRNIQPFAGELVHHRQDAQSVAMYIAILYKVVSPDVIWIGCRQRSRSLATCLAPRGAFNLETCPLPQSMDTLAVDSALAPKQRPDPPVAIARMLLGQRSDVGKQCCFIGTRSRSILKCSARKLNKHTSASHRDATRRQELHCITLLGNGQTFFANNSLRASTSSSRSASSRLSLAFSFSSSLRRWASLTDIPA
jgi:hypothetical protein